VAQWRFEVWDEPNLDGFSTAGDQQAYFRLYDTTAKAIKASLAGRTFQAR
jgi:xylan 1,4-beta-xylosidase